jgi:two-component system, response regulator YesN
LLKVLIVEDEDLEIRALKFIINKYYSEKLEVVGVASNGMEAVYKSSILEPDIILMDINMPMMDGLEASAKIKEQNKKVEIIILTAYDYFEYARRSVKLGVFDYLLKPFSNEEFVDSINKLIKGIEEKTEYMMQQDNEIEEDVPDYYNKSNMILIETAKKYIQMNYNKEISLDEIAKHVSMSTYHLSRIFSKFEGITYKDYLIKLRMEKAKGLMKEGKKSIKEISIEVGYTDQNYFSKSFKKYFSKSPSDFYIKNST